MTTQIKALTSNITANKGTWVMAGLNIIATLIIANGGADISKNKEEISNGVNNIAVLHKRISAQDIEIAKLTVQIDVIKDNIKSLTRKVDRK